MLRNIASRGISNISRTTINKRRVPHYHILKQNANYIGRRTFFSSSGGNNTGSKAKETIVKEIMKTYDKCVILVTAVDLNKKDQNGCTPLMKACEYSYHENNLNIVKCLIKYKVNLDLQNNGYTALMLAIKNNKNGQNNKAINDLINAGANISLVNKLTGDNALMLAIKNNNNGQNNEIIKRLIKTEKNINYANENMKTVLMLAILCNDNGQHDEIITELIDAGVNINAKDKWGCTALLHAVAINEKGQNNKVIDKLINAGVDVNATDINGSNAITFLLSKNSYTEKTKYLLDKFINIGIKVHNGSNTDSTLLFKALNIKSESLRNYAVTKLINEGAKLDSEHFLELIYKSLDKSYISTIKILLKEDISIYAINNAISYCEWGEFDGVRQIKKLLKEYLKKYKQNPFSHFK